MKKYELSLAFLALMLIPIATIQAQTTLAGIVGPHQTKIN